MSRRASIFANLSLVILAACGTSGSQVPGGGAQRMGDPDFILREEIDRSTARSAHELVRNHRPQWLQTRGITTFRQAAGQDGIKVYMDNARLENVDAMRRVTLSSIVYLRFFTASEATQRWGGGHLNGAILLSTQPR